MMRFGLIIALLTCLSIATAAPADESTTLILDQAPADSDLLVIVPSLSRLSEKIALFDGQIDLGLADLRNVWSQVKRTAGLTDAVMDNWPAMVAVSTARGDDASVDKARVWLLLPVSDYAKAITALRGNGDGEVTPVILATGHRAFAARNRSFAVFAADRDTVKAYRPANAAAAIVRRLGPLASQQLQTSDIAIVLHGKDHAARLKALTQVLAIPPINTVIDEALTAMTGNGMQDSVLDRLDAPLLRDADAAVLGLAINDDGLALTYGAQFKPGSSMADTFTGRDPAAEVLARLPKMSYTAAGAANLQGIKYNNLKSLTTDAPFIAAWLQKTILQVGEKGQPITGFAQVKYSSGRLGPPVVQYIATDKAAGFIAALQKNIVAMNAPPDRNRPDQQTFTAQYFPNYMVHDGKRVDQYHIRPNEFSAAAQPSPKGALSLLAPAGFAAERNGYVVELEQAVMITERTDNELLMSVIDAAAGDQGLGLGRQGSTAAARQYLAEQSSLEVYLDLVTAYDMSADSGQDLTDLPEPQEEMAPIALGLKVADRGVVFRCFVPAGVSAYIYHLTPHFRKTRQEQIADQQRPPPRPGRPGRRPGRPTPRRALPANPLPGGFTPPL